jgi:ABC-type phosphate transport system auxiliary subunit
VESRQRIQQIVVIALLVVLAVDCMTVLWPFLVAAANERRNLAE